MEDRGRGFGGHARTLLPLSAALQKKAAQTVVGEELSVRQTEALVKRLNAKPAEEKKHDRRARQDIPLSLNKAENGPGLFRKAGAVGSFFRKED